MCAGENVNVAEQCVQSEYDWRESTTGWKFINGGNWFRQSVANKCAGI